MSIKRSVTNNSKRLDRTGGTLESIDTEIIAEFKSFIEGYKRPRKNRRLGRAWRKFDYDNFLNRLQEWVDAAERDLL